MSNGSIEGLALQLIGPTPAAVVSLDGGIGERAGGTYLAERTGGSLTRLRAPLMHLYTPDNSFLDFAVIRSPICALACLARPSRRWRRRRGSYRCRGSLRRCGERRLLPSAARCARATTPRNCDDELKGPPRPVGGRAWQSVGAECADTCRRCPLMVSDSWKGISRGTCVFQNSLARSVEMNRRSAWSDLQNPRLLSV